MTLPAIELPKIELPFDIPVLIHPAIDHFAIVLPIVILLLEFYNLFAKKKSIGGFSFLLILLTIIVFAGAYLTGVVDGKEAYDLLSPEGQTELKEHKLLGTYLVFFSLIVLFFKLLAMTGKTSLKFLFFIVLIGFSAMTLNQGKEGGELVYEYGANVERVKALDDELFDVQEALEELQEKKEVAQIKALNKDLTSNEIPTQKEVEAEKPEKVEEAQTVVEDVPNTSMNEKNVTKDSEPTVDVEKVKTLPSFKNNIDDITEQDIEVIPMDIERPKIETH
ncbi:MAG TPA: hypothetical protein EYH42_09935 [Sulfurovum sp.]|nr:hypothetical protein [Sulfurovum sp.]